MLGTLLITQIAANPLEEKSYAFGDNYPTHLSVEFK
jgi:hypothetical protein